MTKTAAAAVLTGTILLGACQPKAPPAPPKPQPAAPAKAAFTLSPLAETDYNGIQGCMTVFGPAGAKPGADIFVEDAVDTDAKGLMKVDGQMVGVKLVSQTQSGKGGLRLFRSADGKLSVAENYVTGTSHEDSDSVELSGTLTVTWNGASQAIKVDGGTAC
jgi:hypothetical protein